MSQTGCWTGRSIAVQTVHCSPVSEGCTGASGLLAVAAGLKQCGMFLLSAVLCTVRPGQLHSLVNIRRNAIYNSNLERREASFYSRKCLNGKWNSIYMKVL